MTIVVGALDGAALAQLRSAAARTASWPAGSHLWGQYAEQTAQGAAICRTENVSACEPEVASLVDGVLRDLATDALGEPAVAFKDKINYKQPGGAGFSPHQDTAAYPGARRVWSILVAIDDCTIESGCLWLARGVDTVLPSDERGAVRADVAAELRFEPAELRAGDAVCIDGLAPHYSEPNRSGHARRVLVVSCVPEAERYTRVEYYAARADAMAGATGRDGRFRISTLADFQGDEVAPAEIATTACTHAPVTWS